MVKIFVAQTHDQDRSLVSDFLKSSGYSDVSSHGTDPTSLTWLSRDMMFARESFVILTSQRNTFIDYVPNILQLPTLSLPFKTLMIVYTRAAAHQEHMPGVARYFAMLMNTPQHQLKIVPKVSEDTRPKEFDEILTDIRGFEQSIK